MYESQTCNIPNLAPSEGFGFVYAISDPLNPNVPKYIGKTKNTLRWRLCSHLEEASRFRGDKMKPFFQWLNEMLQESRLPKIYTLEICKLENIKEREQYWINFFLPLGILNRMVSRPIVCIDTGERFVDFEDAARKIGTDSSTLSRAVRTNGKCFGKRYKFEGTETKPPKQRNIENVSRVTIARNKLGWTREMRENYSKSMLENNRTRPVMCVDTGKKYFSMKDAAKDCGIHPWSVKDSAVRNRAVSGFRFALITKEDLCPKV